MPEPISTPKQPPHHVDDPDPRGPDFDPHHLHTAEPGSQELCPACGQVHPAAAGPEDEPA
jgi:hypothetical protein